MENVMTTKQAEQSNYMTARDAAAWLGVELRGSDGQPYCCGVRMSVKAGFFGTDYARCDSCGAKLANIASMHVNGGHRADMDHPEVIAGRTWMAVRGEP